MSKINDGSGTKYLQIDKSDPFTGTVLDVTGSGKLWFAFSMVSNGQSSTDYIEIIVDGQSYKSKHIGSSQSGDPSCGFFSYATIMNSGGSYGGDFEIFPTSATFVDDSYRYFAGFGDSKSSEVSKYLISLDPIIFTSSLRINVSLGRNDNSVTHIMYQLT